MNNDVIRETYKLPSLGKLNNIKDSVTLRAMTTDEELIRLNATAEDANRIFCDIIDSCVLEPKTFKSYYLPIQDQLFLIYKLRTITYGSQYKINLQCPRCGLIQETTVDLDELPITYLDLDKLKEINTFSLPKSGDIIKLKVLTPAVEDAIQDAIDIRSDKLKRKLKVGESLMERYSVRIQSVNDSTMVPEELLQYLRNLPIQDFQCIKTHDNINNTFGLQTTGLRHICDDCGYTFKFAMPITREFFEPEYL